MLLPPLGRKPVGVSPEEIKTELASWTGRISRQFISAIEALAREPRPDGV